MASAVNGTAASRNVSSKNSRLGMGLAYLTASADCRESACCQWAVAVSFRFRRWSGMENPWENGAGPRSGPMMNGPVNEPGKSQAKT